MKNTEARKILGLDAQDDPRSYLPAFEETKQYKKELIENAPSDRMRFRYEQELLEYEAAVRVVAGQRKLRPNTDFIVVLMLIGALCACGWWGYNWYQRQWNLEAKNQQRITYLNSVGRIAISKRKWSEAEKAYKEVLEIDPSSSIATEGVESIKRGKMEERSQQLYYSLGESQAALEAGRWDEAERLANSVIEIDPENTVAKRKLEMIYEGRYKQTLSLKMLAITEAVDDENIPAARAAIADLRDIDPQNANLPNFIKRVDTAAAAIRERSTKSLALLEAARRLDNGEFSPEAMALLAEARKLAPNNQEIAQLHSKMSNYTRAINVPADYPTISEALAAARPRDLIRIAPGTYAESLDITQPVRLQGSADGKTILQIPATEASIITLQTQAKGTLISGLTLKHESFDHGTDRFSGITVMAQEVTIVACTVSQAGGHGIAVLENASASITGCDIGGSGWDGISVYGNASQATIRDTRSHDNIQHGLGLWGGGSGSVEKSNLSKNGFCGIFAMGSDSQIGIVETICSRNREAGILISNGVSANVNANRCDKNLLSGIVARDKDTKVILTNNVTEGNLEAGLVTYTGVQVAKFENNQAKGNARKQILRDVITQTPAE